MLVALDIGQKRVGVARSRSGRLVEPVGVWPRAELLARLRKWAAAEPVERLIVGLATEELAAKLAAAAGAPVEQTDESFSTNEARRRVAKLTPNDHADAAAAAVILERWLADHPR